MSILTPVRTIKDISEDELFTISTDPHESFSAYAPILGRVVTRVGTIILSIYGGKQYCIQIQTQGGLCAINPSMH